MFIILRIFLNLTNGHYTKLRANTLSNHEILKGFLCETRNKTLVFPFNIILTGSDGLIEMRLNNKMLKYLKDKNKTIINHNFLSC